MTAPAPADPAVRSFAEALARAAAKVVLGREAERQEQGTTSKLPERRPMEEA